ncbi:alpha/beta hydrolase [Rhodopirellula sp. JC740]|uniref:Alpha/beta hydrolase n=1 Tax=Rhodopirellula halodulae TaxID=2894198 RepID=A0ABS8NDY6_9BACT|nr:alpha/beta hydrolase [Rhodopirellula sp. JC740]MCC9641759.1 alpha/beta hydrolase [Rhodopirellula sp. JC740]
MKTSPSIVTALLFLLVVSMINFSPMHAAEPETLSLWTDEELGSTEAENTEVRKDRGDQNAWVGNINRPTLTVYQADPDKRSGTAMVVCPGGGYGGLAIDKEGHVVAQWLAEQGVTAGVLKYRCGGGANKHPIPMGDARKAVQVMREHADDWDIKTDQVGIMGFSAGGHLASTIATDPETGVNFAALIYPVVSFRDGVTHGGSKKNLLGDSPSDEMVRLMSRDEQVTPETCPTFLVHSGDDGAVPVQNSIRFYEACLKHNVQAEMHLFPTGGHGCGMFRGDRPVDHWPNQFKAWLQSNGWCE